MEDGPVKSLHAKSLVAAVMLAAFCSIASHSQGYIIDGKPVGKTEYDAAILSNEARGLLQAQKWTEAEAKLRQALQQDPKLKPARNNLGIVLVRLGKYDEAITVLKSLVDEDGSQSMAWATLGASYMSVGKIEEAIAAYRKFLALEPNYKEAARYKDLVRGLEAEAAKRKSSGSTQSKESYASAIPKGTPKWASFDQPLKVFIPKTSTVRGYKPEYEKILTDAFKKWQTATGDKVRFDFVDNIENSDIDCTWKDDPTEAVFKAEGGHAHLDTLMGKVKHAKIFLLTVWSMNLAPTDALMGKLALHEVGHSLGIIGHSDNRDDIMFFTIDVSPKEGEVSQRDVKTLNELYQ